jgi:hypothetical protein
MCPIQSDAQREQIPTVPTGTKTHNKEMKTIRLADPKEASLRAFEAGKRAGWLRSGRVSLSMNNLLSDNEVDPNEEHHMTLRSQQLDETQMEYISTTCCLPLTRNGFSERSLSAPPVAQPTSREKESSSMESLTRQTAYWRDADSKLGLRMKGEHCPNYRLEETKDDFSTRNNILRVTPRKTTVPSSHKKPIPAPSASYILDQEAMLSLYRRQSRRSLPPRLHEQDQNTKIKIFDQDRVYDAIDRGTAMVLKCVACGKHMLASDDIKLIFCPACCTLAPVELARARASSSWEASIEI